MHPKPDVARLFDTPRCGARTRKGAACRSPAVRGRHRCRMHGGAKGSGGPPGERNGRYTEGRFTKAAKQAARERQQAARERRRAVGVATAMVRHFVDVIEGREEETPAFAAQWEAEGAAAIETFRKGNPAGYVRLVLGLCR